MKKILFVFVLAAILVTGTAFADHPDSFGIGVQGGGGYAGGAGSYGAALTIKETVSPIFWAISFGFGNVFGISGDIRFLEGTIVETINLHWYVAAGIYGNIYFPGNEIGFGIGGQLPIGLSWHLLDFLELYFQVVPHIGVKIASWTNDILDWGVNANLGIRIWF